jgi:monoamine oxidase
VKRRIALKKIGLGVSAGLILPSWLAACKDEEDPKPKIDYNGVVVVVGAGAAGLYVADILQASGIEVIILEASNRVGGRVRSLKSIDKPSLSLLFNSPTSLSNDFSPELGAEQIIGTDSIWGKIVSQLKLSTVNLETTATDSYFLDNVLRTGASVEADPDFIAAKNFLNNLSTYSGSNVSIEQAVQAAGINPRVHAILNSWIGNRYGTQNDRIGVKAMAEGQSQITRNKTKLLLTDNPMQDALLSRFSSVASKVQRNKVVKSIDYTGSKIIINGDTVLSPASTEPFTVEADKVIVTVPASILKAGDIVFNPALSSDKTNALSNMEMDASLRVLVDFKINFWGKESGFLYGGSDGPEYFNNGVGRSDLIKTLSITINGEKAAALSLLGKDMIPVLLAELDSIYDGKATLHARRDLNDNIVCVIQDWSKENYIRGGMAYLKPGGTNQHRINLGSSVNGKLFFAGEATDSKGEFGTINGALLSGERAAAEVISSL